MSDTRHGGGGGRRDRSTSVLQSTPQHNRSIAGQAAAAAVGGAAAGSSGPPLQKRHGRQGSADWANLAAATAASAPRDSPTGSSSRAFVPAPAVLEDDEIEGTEVPFFASTRFDESPHQHRGSTSSSSNGIGSNSSGGGGGGGGGSSAGSGLSSSSNSAASTSASASSVAASSTSAAVRPVSSGALSPAGGASASSSSSSSSSRRTPSSMGSKLEPTVQEDEEGYSERIHVAGGPPPHAHVAFAKQKSTPSVHHHMPPHPATHTWVPERRGPGIAFSPPPAPASSPSPPPFQQHPAPVARPLSVRLHSPSHSSGVSSALNSPSCSTIETVPVVIGEGAGTSAPVSTTTSPATLERVSSMEQQRPRTTSHATLSARGCGTSFADAIQSSAGAATSDQQPVIVVDHAPSDSAHNFSGVSPATPLSARAASSESPIYSSPPSAGSSHSRHVSFPNLSVAQQSRLRGATVSMAGDRTMVASNRSSSESKRHESTASLSILTGPASLRDHRRFSGRLDSLGSDLSVDDNVGGVLSSPPSPRPPLSGSRLWVRLIRTKLMPQFRGRTWSSKSIIDRFLSHTYGQFDVTSMLAQQFGLEEFKQRMAAKLHHLDGSSSSTVVAPTTASITSGAGGVSVTFAGASASDSSAHKAEKVNEIVSEMSDMFRSLKTFHKLLDGTSALHAHLSKRQALQNIISTVFALLDAEKVTVFLLHTKTAEEPTTANGGSASSGNGGGVGGGGVTSHVTLKAVSAVTNAEGETVLRPADVTVASELVSIVARTGELRNIRDCATEPLCWIGSNSPNVAVPSGMPHSASASGLHQLPQTTQSPASSFDFSSPTLSASPATPSIAPLPQQQQQQQSLSSTAPSALHLAPQGQTAHGHGTMSILTSLVPFPSAAGASGSTPTPGSSTPLGSPIPGHGHGHGHGSMRRHASPKYFSQTMRIFPKVAPPGESGEWGSLGAAALVLGSLGSPAVSDGSRSPDDAPVGFSSPVPSKATAAISGSPLSASLLSSPTAPQPTTSPPPAHSHNQARLAALALLSPPPPVPAAFLTPQHAAMARVDFSATMGAIGTSSGSITARNSDGVTASPAPSRSLFDRGGSLSLPLGSSPSPPAFQLRNCLCVPVRGNTGAKDSGECTSADGSAGGSCAALGSGSKSMHRSDPGKEVVAVLQVCNKKSGPYFTSEDVQILQFISLLAGQSLTNANLYSEALVRRRQQEALCTMIELMSAETGVDEVIECIIQAAYRLLEVDRISLYIVDELRAQLVCKVSKDANAIGQRLPLKWGLIGRVAQEGKSINISDAANDPRFDRTLDKVTGYQTRNILTLPIQDNKNRVAAVIQISNKKKGNFSREDETLMMSLSRSAGQILRKAQLFSALLTEQRKTKALMDILRAEEGEPSIESLCDRIMQTTHDVLPCQRVALCFVDAVREDLYALVAEPLGKSDATAAAATGAATPVPAAAASQQPNHESANTSPIAAAPSHSHVVGTPVGGGAILFSPRSGSEEQLYSARGSPARDLSGNASLSNSASSSSLAKPKRTGTKGGMMPALPSTTLHLSLPLHRGLAGWAAEHGQSCNLSNALADPRYDPLFDKTVSSLASASAAAASTPGSSSVEARAKKPAAAFKTRTSLCVPLHNTTGTTIAVLQAINRIKKKDEASGSSSAAGPEVIVAFSEEDEEIFNALCIQAGITLRRRLTEVLLGRSRRELGDDKQINSLFEIYGGNYLSSSGGAATPSQQQGLDSSIGGSNVSRSAQTPTSGSSMTPIASGHMLPLSPSARMTTSDSKQMAIGGSGNSSFGGPSPGARARRKTLSEMPTRKPFTAPLALPKPHASSPAAGSPPVAPAPAPAPSGSSLSSPPPPSSSAVGSKHTCGAGSSGGVALPTIPSSPSPAALPASSSMIAQDYTYVPTPLPSPVNAPLGGTGGSTELSAVAGQGTVSRLMPTPSSTRSSRSVSPRPRLSINPSTGPIVAAATSSEEHGSITPVLVDDGSSSFMTDAVAADMGAVSSNLEMGLTRRRLGAMTVGTSSAGATDSESDSQPQSPSHKQQQQLRLVSASRSSSSTDGGVRFPWPVLTGPTLICVEVSALHSMETFNVFDYTEDQLVHFSLLMLHDLRLVGDFGFSLPKLQSFLVAVRRHYNANPYHNYAHGFAVMHFAYWMLRQTDAIMFLSKVDQLALLIAALCHDVDHPGTTNGFQIAKQSDVARAHNDVAVLENHHAFVTFELLRDPELNVLTPDESEAGKAAAAAALAASASAAASMTPGPRSMSGGSPPSGSDAVVPWTALHFRNFRKTVIGAILATDMSKHFALCSKLDSMEPECGSLDPSKEEDRQFMIDLLTHSADLSAQVLPYEMARAWEDRLTQEFIHQSEMEETLGLPISTFMQGLADPAVRFKAHLNYLDYIASPLWMGVAELLPPLSICVRNLLDNRKRFMRFIPQEEQEDAAAAAAAGAAATGGQVGSSSSATRENTPPDSEPASPMLDSPSRRLLDRPLSLGPSPQQPPPQAPASVGMPTRALSVGLLRQQRVAAGGLRTSGDGTPPLPPRSYSFTSPGGNAGNGGGGLLGPSSLPDDELDGPSCPPPRSASVDPARCTHHRASSSEGLCAQCSDEGADGYPASEANTPGGYATPVASSSHFHRRKLSAPVIAFGSPSGSHTPSSHTSSGLYVPHGSGGSGSSGGAGGGASSHHQHSHSNSLSSPHSTHSRHSSQGEMFLLSSSPSGSHGLLGGGGVGGGSQNLAVGAGGSHHQRSVSGSSSPGGGAGGLSVSDTQQRRMISSQCIRDRKAARWSALTAASGVGCSSSSGGGGGSGTGSSLSNGASASSSAVAPSVGVGIGRPLSGSLENPSQLGSSPPQFPLPSLPSSPPALE